MDTISKTDQITEVYSPEAIEHWLRSWELLDGLVMSPATSRHHLEPYHNRYASKMAVGTPCEPVNSGAGVPSLHWAEFRADIELGISRLTDPLERAVLVHVAAGGTLSSAAKKLHRQKSRVIQAFHDGVDHCARALGWQNVHVTIEQTVAVAQIPVRMRIAQHAA